MADQRMLDYAAVTESRLTLSELSAGLTPDRLHQLTDEMLNTIRAIVRRARDADVIFVPVDVAAHDAAALPEERYVAWTLAHVVAHVTASAEESAAISSSMSRGILTEERSRFEVDWHTVNRTEQLLRRLEESRRMRHSFLNTWPTEPHLDLVLTDGYFGSINAVARFVLGLWHEDAHLAQLREIVRQAKLARRPKWVGRLLAPPRVPEHSPMM